jgi:hypothetical protein
VRRDWLQSELKAEYEILEKENEANRAQLEAAKKELEAAKQAELDKTISAAKNGYKTQIVDVRELNAPKYLKVTLKEDLPPASRSIQVTTIAIFAFQQPNGR